MLGAGTIVVAVELLYQGHHVPPHGVMALDRIARIAMAWGMILTLLHAANRWGNRDHRWRRPLAEAVFPAYLVHQPVIVVTTWLLLPLDFAPMTGFTIILAITALACFAAYALGRRIPWLRPLIGLGVLARPRSPAMETVPA